MTAMLLMALSVGAPIEAKDDAKAQLAKLQGVWQVTALESGGVEQAPARARATNRSTLVIVGDGYAFSTQAGTIKIDPAAKTLDLAITDGRYKDQTVLALYELTDDTLKIAMESVNRRSGRPAALKTSDTTTHTLYTFTREKATKEQAEAKLKVQKEAVVNQPVPGAFPNRPATTDRATQELLRQVLDKLDRIEKRLDAMEKKSKEK